jgi:hypothetical protein
MLVIEGTSANFRTEAFLPFLFQINYGIFIFLSCLLFRLPSGGYDRKDSCNILLTRSPMKCPLDAVSKLQHQPARVLHDDQTHNRL